MKYENTQGGFMAVVIAVIALVLIGGGALYYNSAVKSDEAMMEKENGAEETHIMEDGKMMEGSETMMKKEDAMKKDEGAMMEKPEGETMVKAGSYEAYAQEKLMRAKDGDVVLFFKADWCPTCRALDKDITANAPQIPAGLSILTLDYDASTELKKKYGVTYQHTLVQVDAQGDLVKKWSGTMTLAALVAEVK